MGQTEEPATGSGERRKRRSSARKPARASIISHPIFTPALCAWGAALFGLMFVVLPGPVVDRLGTLTGLGDLGGFAPLLFAAIAALFGALCGFVLARLISDYHRQRKAPRKLAQHAARRVQPIDPVAELGSDSLDAPIETVPFAADDPTLADERASDIETATDGDATPLSDAPLDELEEPAWIEEAYETEAETEADAADEQVDETDAETEAEAVDEPVAETDAGETDAEETGAGETDAPEPAAPSDPALAENADVPLELDEEPAYEAPLDLTDTLDDAEEEASPEQDSSEPDPDTPRALDLAQFAQLAGRNAVWVEEPREPGEEEAEAVADPEPPALLRAKLDPAIPKAAAKLRQTPLEELSMIQMIERFAVALDEHKAAVRENRAKRVVPQREAALAEAVQALSVLAQDNGPAAGASDDGEAGGEAAGSTTSELRDALAKLQKLRGAA